MATLERVEDSCEEQGIHPASIRSARASLPSDSDLASLGEMFSALSDSNRIKILFSLTAQELCVCDLATVVGVSESAISQHLRVLRALRWVRGRREGRMIYYSLEDEHVEALLKIEMEHMRGA